MIRPLTHEDPPLTMSGADMRRLNPHTFTFSPDAQVRITRVDNARRADGWRGSYEYHATSPTGSSDGGGPLVSPDGSLMVTIPGYAFMADKEPFLRVDNPWLWVIGAVPVAGALLWWHARRESTP